MAHIFAGSTTRTVARSTPRIDPSDPATYDAKAAEAWDEEDDYPRA